MGQVVLEDMIHNRNFLKRKKKTQKVKERRNQENNSSCPSYQLFFFFEKFTKLNVSLGEKKEIS